MYIISIFISKFDVFKKGFTTYHVERVIRQTSDVVDNGTKEIYVNCQIDDGTDIAAMMQVLSQDAAYNDGKFPKTSARKRLFKTTNEGVNTMCEIIERNRREAAEEATAKATAETKTNIVVNLLKMKLSYEDIAKATQITVDKVMEIGKQASIL